MRNRISRFLVSSAALVTILCAAVFSFLAFFMNKRSLETIREIGNIYMSGMSEQISRHFGTTMILRLSQIEALLDSLPPERQGGEELRESLTYNAKARGFEYLAFYSEDGQFEMIYGAPVHVTDPKPFLDSLNRGEKKVAVGTDAQGNNIVLLGVSSTYEMSGGLKCTALVAGLPVEYISTTLSLDVNDSLVYSHIMRTRAVIRILSASWRQAIRMTE